MTTTDPSLLCPQSVTSPSQMNEIYGALLLGTFFGLILYGLSVHQLYRYFRLYPQDLIFVRSMVMLTMIFETMHAALTLHACYFYLVDNYLCPGRLSRSVWSINLLALSTGIIMFMAQLFFARRLYKVGPGYRIAVFLATVFLAGEFAFAIAATIEMYSTHSLHAFWDKTWLVSVCYGMATVADTLLTIALIIVLQRSRTGMSSTDSLIDVLIVYAINTGLATGVFNVLSLILSSVMPQNFIYLCFNIITARLYANSLLAAVNSRAFSIPGGSEIFELDRVPRPHGILGPASRSASGAQWGAHQQTDENCSSVLNIKGATEVERDGIPELRKDAGGDDARLDSKRSSTVVGIAVQLPSPPHTASDIEDVKRMSIRE